MKARSLLAATLALSVLVGLTFNGSAFAAAEDGPPASLAIVETDPELSPLSSLLEVQLSRQGLSLVERSELDRILQEQELSTAGLVDRAALLTVGRLVRADAFLLLSLEVAPKEGDEPEGLLRVRLVETVHGVRLLDWFAAWRPDEAEEAAAGICQTALGAISKLKLPPGKLIPIGIVDIHRVQLGEEHQWVCRALTTMLSSRLGKEPRIVVLEREDLKLLMEEKQITEGEEGRFWGSGVLVDGYVRGEAGKPRELQLRLRRPSGEHATPFTVPVRTDDLQGAAEEAARYVIGEVTGAPATSPWDPQKEAAEFFREGKLLRDHRRRTAAVPLLETAYALDPENLAYAVELAGVVLHTGPWKEGPYTEIEQAELVSQLLPLLQERMREQPPPVDAVLLSVLLEQYMSGAVSVADERVIEINRRNRDVVADLHAERLGRAAERRHEVPGTVRLPLTLALIRSSTPEEGIANIKELVRKRMMPPAESGEAASEARRCENCCAFVQEVGWLLSSGRPWHLVDSSFTFHTKLIEYIQELAGAGDPLVRFSACMVLASLPFRTSARTPTAESLSINRRSYLEEGLAAFETELQSSDEFTAACRRAMCRKIKMAMSAVCSPEETVAILERLCGPLIQNGDVDALMEWQLNSSINSLDFRPVGNLDRVRAAGRAVRLLQRQVEVLAGRSDEEEVAAAVNRAHRVANAIADRHCARLLDLEGKLTALETKGDQAAAKSLRRQADAIREEFPEFVPILHAPRVPVRMLLRAADWPRRWSFLEQGGMFTRAELQDGVLWLVLTDQPWGHRTSRLGVVGIDMVEGRVVALWQTSCEECGGGRPLSGLVVGDPNIYVAIQRLGIMEFPGSRVAGRAFLENPRILTEEDGLPPGHITGIAANGDRLWVAYANGESGLGVYDPKTQAWETVFCSTLMGDSPLASGEAYQLRELTPLAGGLLFLVKLLGERDGLWWLDSEKRTAEFLLSVRQHKRIVDVGNGLWLMGWYILAPLVPESEKVELLMVNSEGRRYLEQRGDPKWQLEEATFASGSPPPNVILAPYQFGGLDLFRGAVHGEEVWARLGKSRLVVLCRGQSLDEAQVLPNNALEGGKVLKFLSTPYGLVAIGEGSVGLIESESR